MAMSHCERINDSITIHVHVPPPLKRRRWLREHCDYTFQTLRDNLPKALASVELLTIWKWERRMIRWMEAYTEDLTAKDTQFKVQAFSSRRYKSHRRVPETVARSFDT